MKTNRNKLPMMSVSGRVDHPSLSGDGHWVGFDGYGRIAMSVGGIVYNYALLDSCMGSPEIILSPEYRSKIQEINKTVLSCPLPVSAIKHVFSLGRHRERLAL